MLVLERRRSDRSGKPFVLVCLDLSSLCDDSGMIDLELSVQFFSSLRRCFRETDLLGWLIENHTAGAVLTELGDRAGHPVISTIRSKVETALSISLPGGVVKAIDLAVYLFPDRDLETGQPFFEIALTAGFADLDTGVTRNYLLRVESIAPFTTIPYWLEVEVDPYSRGCPGDPWDENWADYDRDNVSETSCSNGECAVALSTGEDALPTRAQICPWDHGDVFFHEISAGANRSIRVAYDHTATTHIAAVLYHDQDGDLVEIGEVCPEAERGSSDCDDSPGIIEGEFDDLVAGDYQLRVWSEDPAPNEVSVFFFE